MKRYMFIIAIVLICCFALTVVLEVLAGRGGRGGGGGRAGVSGGGGGGRVGGGSMGGGGRPSPAVGSGLGVGGSRPPVAAARPSVGSGAKIGGGGVNVGGGGGLKAGGGVGPAAGARPSQGQLGNFLNVGGPGGVGGAGGAVGRPGASVSQGAIGDFFNGPGPGGPGGGKIVAGTPGVGKPGMGKVGDGKLAGAKIGDGKLGAKAGQLPANRPVANGRPERIENRQQWSQNRQDRRQQISNDFRDNHPRFDWAVNNPRWAAWRINRPYRWAAAAALTGWVGFGGASYYDYGENMYYQDGAVYSDGQQVATAEQYAAAAEQIATSVPTAKDPEWLTLGVFALTQDGQASGPAPTMFVQLNVSKEGIIGGTLQNTATGTAQPIEGMVDKQSQRAAWTIAGKTRPIMEAGIFNLTKDTAPALLHFADGQTQQWLLVRLDEPKE